MNGNIELGRKRLEHFVELLDIPPHHYELSTNRYRSLAEWFHRSESAIVAFDPEVYPQGSFRLGTVIRPVLRREEYDLDLVAELVLLTKDQLTQAHLKHLLGEEVKAYAHAKSIKSPVDEKPRCWRLDYADEVKFHMDVLPALPEDEIFKQLLMRRDVPEDQARQAIAITDKRHPQYTVTMPDWPRSNPRGFAMWFEQRMRAVAGPRLRTLVEQRVYASIDEVPAYQWKTPLQRSVQILKRHRDVMFKDNPDIKPISMIITTLAGRGYEGETDLYEALMKIIDRMPRFVNNEAPRIPNPVNPGKEGEDFADKWQFDPRLERNFWAWHSQVQADFSLLAGRLSDDGLRDFGQRKLGLDLAEETVRVLSDGGSAAASAVPTVVIKSPPRPWARHG